MKAKSKTSEIVKLALFTAIIVLMTAVPVLGYIPLGAVNATIIQIPVIIGGVILGWKKGAFLGGVFAVTSMIKNTLQPNLTSFVFSPFVPVFGEESGSPLAILVCFVPRILIGVVAGVLFETLSKTNIKKPVVCGICGFCGALTNTVLVMGEIFLFFGRSYSAAKQEAYEALIGTVMATITGIGLVEAVFSAIICAAVCTVLLKYLSKGR